MELLTSQKKEGLGKDPVLLERELLHEYHEYHRSEPSLWDVFLDINLHK